MTIECKMDEGNTATAIEEEMHWHSVCICAVFSIPPRFGLRLFGLAKIGMAKTKWNSNGNIYQISPQNETKQSTRFTCSRIFYMWIRFGTEYLPNISTAHNNIYNIQNIQHSYLQPPTTRWIFNLSYMFCMSPCTWLKWFTREHNHKMHVVSWIAVFGLNHIICQFFLSPFVVFVFPSTICTLCNEYVATNRITRWNRCISCRVTVLQENPKTANGKCTVNELRKWLKIEIKCATM